MKKESEASKLKNQKSSDLPGYPIYPAKDDIYSKNKKDINIDPEDISKTKLPNVKGKNNEKDFQEDLTGNDLDVPGSELDDQQEAIGNEDEENNYYSLGGDNHENLDEDKAGI